MSSIARRRGWWRSFAQVVPVSDPVNDLFDLMRLFWSGRWLIVVVTGIIAITAAVYALNAQSWYTARATVISSGARQLSGGLGQLGGLASLVGVNVGNVSAEPAAVLRSKSLVNEFVQVVLGSDENRRKVFGNDAISLAEFSDFFEKNLRSVYEDKKTGLMSVAVTWTDPVTAASWANEFVDLANRRMRDAAKHEAEQNIEYLQGVLRDSRQPSVQQALGRVLESEMQKLLLASGAEFAFRVIDPAEPPRFRSRPVRTVLVLGAAVLGAFLSSLLIFLAYTWERKRVSGAAVIGARDQIL